MPASVLILREPVQRLPPLVVEQIQLAGAVFAEGDQRQRRLGQLLVPRYLLAVVTQATLLQTYQWGLEPFIVGGIVKSVIAAALLPAAWWGANKLAEKRAKDAAES